MVKKKKYLLACAALAMMVALSACSSSAEQPKAESEKTNRETASGTTEPVVTEGESKPATGTDVEAASTPVESDPTASKDETDSVKGLPEFLPTDFPLPDDAKITTETSGEHEGKKSAMLIFTTEQDMETVTKLYKDYFAAKKLTDSGQVIDDKNIIITGAEPDTGNQWSLIGGIKSSEKGVIELTAAWVES